VTGQGKNKGQGKEGEMEKVYGKRKRILE